MTLACPLCPARYRDDRNGWQGLAEHLAMCHLPAAYDGHTRRHVGCCCWCGRDYAFQVTERLSPLSELALHLKIKGGAEQHYLECKLHLEGR